LFHNNRAVVAAAKARNWQPMTSQQIQALSQIQAAAIVQARKLPNSEISNQVQIQAQALVHAHTQAQIQAGIYKGHDNSSSTVSATATAKTTDHQGKGGGDMQVESTTTSITTTSAETNRLKAIMEDFRRQHTNDVEALQDSNAPEFQLQLSTALTEFWRSAFANIKHLSNQTEQDFKNHNDLPLARIKRIMKSDEDVRMISAEAPVLFAKACELFILDLSIRSWNYSVLHKRRTLQKEDVKEAIQKTDVFDFLVDVIR
jgi:nuclear transcription factor Y, gamma